MLSRKEKRFDNVLLMLDNKIKGTLLIMIILFGIAFSLIGILFLYVFGVI